MTGEVRDVQFAPLLVANTAAEQDVYAVVIPGGSITTASRFQMVISGQMNTRGILPGTFTMRLRLGSAVVAVVAELMLVGATGVNFSCNLEAWLRPDNIVGLGGFFAQNAGDLMTPSGVRLGGASGAVDLSVDQTLKATVQFSAADADNSFARAMAALFVLTG